MGNYGAYKDFDDLAFTKQFSELNGELATYDHKAKIVAVLLAWIQRQDDRGIDKMAVYCSQNNLIMTSEMIRVIGELAEQRLNGDIRVTTKNFVHEDAKAMVFMEMWKMIQYCSLTQDAACINGTKILKYKSGLNNKIKKTKGSTLKKEFRSWEAENKDFLSQVLEVTPRWTQEAKVAYIDQYELITLRDFELGSLR